MSSVSSFFGTLLARLIRLRDGVEGGERTEVVEGVGPVVAEGAGVDEATAGI